MEEKVGALFSQNYLAHQTAFIHLHSISIFTGWITTITTKGKAVSEMSNTLKSEEKKVGYHLSGEVT